MLIELMGLFNIHNIVVLGYYQCFGKTGSDFRSLPMTFGLKNILVELMGSFNIQNIVFPGYYQCFGKTGSDFRSLSVTSGPQKYPK